MNVLPGTIVVTGGAGFIGRHVVAALNDAGHDHILVVDDLSDGRKFRNLVGLAVYAYCDKSEFRTEVAGDSLAAGAIRAVFHLGACTDTTEWNGRMMLDNNFGYSAVLYDWCQRHRIPFVYASSAAVYGANEGFAESEANEAPLNVYGYSKLLFDRYVRTHAETAQSQVVGLRYFNVYGPHETHKGRMASVMFHFAKQLEESGSVRLFEGSGGFGDGEQLRDFVYVEDVAAATAWFLDHPDISGIFNVGTGRARSFNDVARAIIDWYGRGRIDYIPFPADLRAAYQHHTEADLDLLRRAGCDVAMRPLEEGVPAYLDWLADS